MIFEKLPWERMRELGARALIAWKPPASGLPKLQEECGEVVTAVNQYSYGRAPALELARELADNLLMLVQAVNILGGVVFLQAFQEKLARLEQRLAAHSEGCELCAGKGERKGGERCSACFPETEEHDVGCATRSGIAACTCARGLKHQLAHLSQVVASARHALEAPGDAWLEEVFRDFRPEMPVPEWRRRVYERCVAEHERRLATIYG